MVKKCSATTKAGKRCRANSLAGRTTCLFHTPIGKKDGKRARFTLADAYKSYYRYQRRK